MVRDRRMAGHAVGVTVRRSRSRRKVNRERRRAACRRAAERRRSSRRCWRTPASRWRSSSAIWSRGSSSMLAEAVHSVADTSNQGLLLLGGKRAQRAATAEHPFGYGRDRYFYSFVVALLLFSLGSVFAIYEGIHKLEQPGAAHLAAGRGGHPGGRDRAGGLLLPHRDRESRPLKGGSTWWQFIRQSKTPELPVVLLEDFGALIGLVLALLGRRAHRAHRQPGVRRARHDRDRRPARRHRHHPHRRDEEPADRRGRERAGARGGSSGAIEERRRSSGSSTSARSTSGPEELLVAAKIALRPVHCRSRTSRAAIDEAEQRVRSAVPEARLIYLEPDLDRSAVRG